MGRGAGGALALVAAGLLACRPSPPPPTSAFDLPAPAGLPGCARYGPAEPVGRVPPELDELSGLAASRRHPGVFWSHNDSGHGPVLYALERTGRVRAVVRLEGVEVRDVEDVAVGPCGDGDARACVWLADVGDNLALRHEVALLRLPEPDVLADTRLRPEVLPFRYPRGPRDAESLVVDVHSGQPAVITKTVRALGEVYVLEGLGAGRVGRARLLGTLGRPPGAQPPTTAADLHPSGERLLVRTYLQTWELRRPGARSLEEVLQGQPVQVPDGPQRQGEAAAYLPGGDGYLLGTESEGEPLLEVRCR